MAFRMSALKSGHTRDCSGDDALVQRGGYRILWTPDSSIPKCCDSCKAASFLLPFSAVAGKAIMEACVLKLRPALAVRQTVRSIPRTCAACAATASARQFSALNRPPPNYPGHVPLTRIERAGLAVGSGIMSLLDPYRHGKPLCCLEIDIDTDLPPQTSSLLWARPLQHRTSSTASATPCSPTLPAAASSVSVHA